LKVLKILAVTLVVLAVVLALGSTWKVRRAWPQTEGNLAVAGLTAPVEVVRDAWGVPHIWAANEHDLFFAQGYVHAQDRLWQMEMNRHVSAGRLSELFGQASLAADRNLRTFGIRRAAQRDWEVLTPETRAFLEAYAQGVNAYVDENRGSLPVEFSILGVDPEPWTPIDSLAWSKMIALSLGQNHTQELMRLRVGALLGPDGPRALMPGYPEGEPVIVPPGTLLNPGGAEVADPLLTSLLGQPSTSRGSNNWVIHGSRTATGRPLLANDTHLGLAMPSEWYENGLHGGRFNVVGFSFAGVPLVLVGHNDRIAWGISSMNGDAQDLFIEAADSKRETIRESIRLKSGKEVPLEVAVTSHGPIINEALNLDEKMPTLALRWTALDPSRTLDSLAALNLAGNWAAFREALSLWAAPSLNFVYADAANNIGYQGTGKLPVRAPGQQGLQPVPAGNGENDWRGFIPYGEMPSLFNPPSGFIATANHRVVADDYPHFIARDYADPYRARRISDLLAKDDDVTLDDLRRFQTDTYSVVAEALRPHLAAVKPENDLQRRALQQVQSWDLRFTPGSPGATVYYAWYSHLLPAISGDELGQEFMDQFRAFTFAQTPVYVSLMNTPSSPWFDDKRTPGKVETRDDIVRRSFGEAVAFLAGKLGDDPADWRWGRMHTAVLTHQPFGNSGIPPLMRLFNGKAVPIPGEAFTVNAGTPAPRRPYRVLVGVAQRMLVDLNDLGESLAVNSTGQSGHLFHRHREDQIPLWSRGEYRPMLFHREAVDRGAAERLTLTPRQPK
jgi:penicillin amidase